MSKAECSKCHGDGLYHAPTSHGPYCFSCKGTGQVTARKARAPKARELPSTRKIADICAGDPTKLSTDNTRALGYLGLTVEDLESYRNLWNQGIREVAR